MGGTFDPIHLGHLAIAGQARAKLGLDEVVFVPAGRPWQKAAVAAAEDRYTMVQLAVAGRPGFRVSRVEVDRGGPTYTVDTLREFHAQQPDVEWWFVAGADTLAGLDTWHEPDEVVRLAKFAVAARPGAAVTRELGVRGLPVTVLDVDEVDVSSTEIRARLGRGEAIGGLVPPEVEAYIRAHGLYGAGAPA
jgi:nicotinate-nucleotide adenylyltransferase